MNEDLIPLFTALTSGQDDFSNPYSTKSFIENSFSNTPIYSGQVLSPLDNKPTPNEIEQEKRRFERQRRVGNAYDDFMRTFGPSTYEARKELEFKREDEAATDMTVEDLQKQRLQQQLEKNKQRGGSPVNRPELSTEAVQKQLGITPTPDLKDLREEEKEVKKESGVKEGDADTDDTNFFDRLNEKVDLMAMGAAMLAGSSSGKGTAANIGQGLQAGLASRKKEQLQDEAKKRSDALLAIELLKARGTDNRFKNYNSKINDIAASLEGKGVPEDESKGVASIIYAETEGSFVNLDSNTRSKLLDDLIDNTTSWYDIGKPDVDRTKIREVIADISKGIL